jgi:REP element-mobilizing transposase RayT
MAQSLSRVIVHIVFSTKNRRPFLQGDLRHRMHGYLAQLCRDQGAECFEVGGTENHVHIAATLPRTVSQAEFLEFIKKKSSRWLRDCEPVLRRRFGWQAGYGVFSVSRSRLPELVAYIRDQEEHHRRRTFEEEYVRLLRRHGVQFDEQWLWN